MDTGAPSGTSSNPKEEVK